MLFLKSVMHYPNQNMGVRNAILQDSTNLKYAMSEILRDGLIFVRPGFDTFAPRVCKTKDTASPP